LANEKPKAKKLGTKWLTRRKREIKRNNKNFEMACDMMIGIRTMVKKSPLLRRAMMDSDFSFSVELDLPPGL